MENIQHYVLFPNHDNGMRLYRELKKMGLKATIAPTPRAASKCCGISLIVQEEDLDKIRECVREQWIEILKIVDLESYIKANLDRYC